MGIINVPVTFAISLSFYFMKMITPARFQSLTSWNFEDFYSIFLHPYPFLIHQGVPTRKTDCIDNRTPHQRQYKLDAEESAPKEKFTAKSHHSLCNVKSVR
jgi:hypothetical protein